mmetsp:Transcript_41703/g.77115  ORF Transcript_41703/g.77115 Transcript_41703/m.77115 type:complete len:336 (+) Transcript_41703:162-1169(+)
MFHCPYDRIDNQFLVLGRYVEKCGKAMLVDCLQELKESDPMLGIILEIGRDHLQRGLEHRLHYPRHVVQHVILQLLHYRREQGQYLRISRPRNVALVISEDRVQHRRYESLGHRLGFRLRRAALFDEDDQQPQYLLLRAAHRSRQGHLRRDGPLLRDGVRDPLRVHLVHVEHVQEESLQLVRVERSDGVADAVVDFQDLDDLLDGVRLHERLHVLDGLVHDDPPGPIGHLHQLGEYRGSVDGHGRAPVAEHAPDRLVEGLDLVRLQVADDAGEGVHELADERRGLVRLERDELSLALGRDFEEGVARHVLDARVALVHELEQLVHDRLQKLPVCL